MQLIQNQEPQPLGIGNDLLVNGVLPSEQQLQHHEVGQQDVWRVGFHSLALFGAFLSSEAPERHGSGVRVGTKEFLEFFELAVGQSVHRINDDSPGARSRVGQSCRKASIHNGYEIGQ